MNTSILRNAAMGLLMVMSLNIKGQYLMYSPTSIDSLLEQSMSTYQIPGMVFGIMDQDSLAIKTYGYADVQNAAPVIATTNFELASLSKQFTAAAILLLQQRGQLSVEDYIHQYIPDCPKEWNAIKIKQLIWHTAGLPGMFVRDDFKNPSFTGYATMSSKQLDAMMQTNTVSKELVFESIKTDKLDFQPGEKHNYSDVGYLVLGLIIDHITGSYRDFMEKEIFVPSGMKHTYILNQEKIVMHQSRGYSLKKGKLINIMRSWDYETPSFFGVFSNVEDLFKWHQVLFSDRLLSKKSRDFLFSHGRLSGGTKINYGGGWNIQTIEGEQYVFHGGITGVSFVILPKRKVSMVSLTNLGYNGNDPVLSLSVTNDVLGALGLKKKIGEHYQTANGHKVVKFSKKVLKTIEGEYETEQGIKAKIYLEKGVPVFDCPAQGMKNRVAFLNNKTLLVLGLDFEYTLQYDAVKKELVSNKYRRFKRVHHK